MSRPGPSFETHSADEQTYIYREGPGAAWEVWIRGMKWGEFKSRDEARSVIRALKAIPNDTAAAKHWQVHEEVYKTWSKKP